jgi:hypothetical protein
MAGMKEITIKLPETTLSRLKRQAKATGRSVAALVRESVEAPGASSRRIARSIRWPPIWREASPAVGVARATIGAGFADRDHHLRHGSAGRVFESP